MWIIPSYFSFCCYCFLSQGKFDWQANRECRVSDAVHNRVGQSDPRQEDPACQGEWSACIHLHTVTQWWNSKKTNFYSQHRQIDLTNQNDVELNLHDFCLATDPGLACCAVGLKNWFSDWLLWTVFQYPLKEVIVIHQDPEALKNIQSLQKYILEVRLFSNFFVNVAFMSNVKNNICSRHVFCWHWDCVKQKVEMFLLHILWQVYLRPDDQWWLQDSRIILAEIYSVLQPSGAECTTVNSVNWQGQVRHPSEGWAWPHGVGKETERSL